MHETSYKAANTSTNLSFTQSYTSDLTLLYGDCGGYSDSPATSSKKSSSKTATKTIQKKVVKQVIKQVVKQKRKGKRDTVQIKISCPSNCTTTQQAIIKAHSKAKTTNYPVFIRDTKLVGYALKVNPQGSIQNIVEISHNGTSYRKTIARLNIIGYQHNVANGMTVDEARNKALAIIAEIRGSEDIYSFINTGLTLEGLLIQYLKLNLTEKSKRLMNPIFSTH